MDTESPDIKPPRDPYGCWGRSCALDNYGQRVGASRGVSTTEWLRQHRLVAEAMAAALILGAVLLLAAIPGPLSARVLQGVRFVVTTDRDFEGDLALVLAFLQRVAGRPDQYVPVLGPDLTRGETASRLPASGSERSTPGTDAGRAGTVNSAERAVPGAGAPRAASETGVTAPPPVMTSPVRGRVIAWFGWRPGGDGRQEYHRGIDIQAPLGSAVRAAADGMVKEVKEDREYGRYLVIDHGGGWETLYAHNDRVLVAPGTRVRRGQVIALVGRSGNATTPHLHFEVRSHGSEKDPAGHIGLWTAQ